jgi:membrane protein
MLSGLVFGEQAARERVGNQISEYVGPETAREVNNLMQTARMPAGGILAASLGGGTLLLGALTVFLHVRRCLCAIWRLDPVGQTGAFQMLLDYLLAIVMVLCVGILLLISLCVSAAWVQTFRSVRDSGDGWMRASPSRCSRCSSP